MNVTASTVILGERDVSLLRLLDRTPATAALILKASITFAGEPFLDERRVRERLQTLEACRLVQSFAPAYTMGGSMRWYRLSRNGFAHVHGPDARLPTRAKFEDIHPSRFEHTRVLAEVICHTLVSAQGGRVRITNFHGDGALVLETGTVRQTPDCHFQFSSGGRVFNVFFEIDNSTEPLTTDRLQSIRSKLRGYEAYQDAVWHGWKRGGECGTPARFRVTFLTKTTERAHHILWLARECARNKDRRLCYASTQDAYLAEADAVRAPVLSDHHGHWQSLVDVHPTAKFLRAPVRLSPPSGNAPGI